MAESEMVERVARAIQGELHGVPFEAMSADNQRAIQKGARAAIEAMRTPTKALVELWMVEMQRQGAVFDDWSPPSYPVDLWHGLIDAALSPA